MMGGIRVGRLFGIDILIDWSWLFIFFLVVWNLTFAFSQWHPEWGWLQSTFLALVASLLFFASVLAHEFAHSLIAIAQGIPVRNITLFLFGGVSNIQRNPDSPGDEFLIAILGPLTSLTIGGVLLFVAASSAGTIETTLVNPAGALASLDPLATLLLWLGSVNIMLGIFNMIPGFPLDGGRVLRSLLWKLSGNLRRATRWATRVGEAIAWLMILTGISMAFGVRIPIFGSGLVGGLWLVFIGWFLSNAAAQSYQQVVIQDVLAGVPVQRMMRVNPPIVASTITIATLIYNYVMGTDDHAFPVVENDVLTGLVTLEDVRKTKRDAWDTTTVREIMTPAERLVTIGPSEDSAAALNKLKERDVNQLPVMQAGRLIGLLRRRDIVRWLQIGSELGAQ